MRFASKNGEGGEEAVEKLRIILTENKDQIIKFVQSDDWESLGELLEEQSKGTSILSNFRWRFVLSDENSDTHERNSLRLILKTFAKNGGRIDAEGETEAGGRGRGRGDFSIGSLLSPFMGMFSFALGGGGKEEGGFGFGGLPFMGGFDLSRLGLGHFGTDLLGGGAGGLRIPNFGGILSGGAGRGVGKLPGMGMVEGMFGGSVNGGGRGEGHTGSSGGFLGGMFGGGGRGGRISGSFD